MASYDPIDELDLISYWAALEEGGDGEAGMEDDRRQGGSHRMLHRHKGFETTAQSEHVLGVNGQERSHVSFLRMPVAGFSGHELDLQYDPQEGAEAIARMSLLKPVEEVPGGALAPGSLRTNALERLWQKLDFIQCGEIEDMVAQVTAGGGLPRFVVQQKGHHNAVTSLSNYERGLLDYATPRIRDVCEREGGMKKKKFHTICQLCLAGSKQITNMHAEIDEQKEIFSPSHRHRPARARSPPSGSGMGTTPKRQPGGGSSPYSNMDASPNGRTPDPYGKPRSPSPRKAGFMFVNDELESNIGSAPATVVSEAPEELYDGSALTLLLERIFDKLDVEHKGYLETVPNSQAAGLTSFEAALLELAQYQLQYELKNNRDYRLTKEQVVWVLQLAMDQDYPAVAERGEEGDHKVTIKKRIGSGQGYPPLETAMRSVYREARKIRCEREPTNDELELAECTFHPAINRHVDYKTASGGPTHPRSRNAIYSGTQSRSMSTRDMREFVELQECTFTPNLYKHLSQNSKKSQRLYEFDMGAPQYRSKRRGANMLVQELEKCEVKEGHAEGAMHIHGTRGKLYWQENLRRDSAASQYSLNLQSQTRATSDVRDKPDSGMDLGRLHRRHDSGQIRAAPRDWGKYIRVHDVRYAAEEQPTGGENLMTEDEEASRAFAESFLALRQQGQGTNRAQRAVLM